MSIRLHGSTSQACQESFAFAVAGERDGGFFLEVGASDGLTLSNTRVLEADHGWSGVAIEFDPKLAESYREARTSAIHQADARSVDYSLLLNKANAPRVIDYLQVDIEPPAGTLRALKQILKAPYRYRCITFEHDIYASRRNWLVRRSSRTLLTRHGYKLVAKDVKHAGSSFEDWWVDPGLVVHDRWSPFVSSGREGCSFFVSAPEPGKESGCH